MFPRAALAFWLCSDGARLLFQVCNLLSYVSTVSTCRRGTQGVQVHLERLNADFSDEINPLWPSSVFIRDGAMAKRFVAGGKRRFQEVRRNVSRVPSSLPCSFPPPPPKFDKFMRATAFA
jgi:hypothetical protein